MTPVPFRIHWYSADLVVYHAHAVIFLTAMSSPIRVRKVGAGALSIPRWKARDRLPISDK